MLFRSVEPDRERARRDGLLHVAEDDALLRGRQLAHEGVKAVLNKKANKPIERRLDTGVELVKKDNIDTPKIQNLIKERK